jgi:hypothetical protein
MVCNPDGVVNSRRTRMTPEQRKAAYALLWVWAQYGGTSVVSENGRVVAFEHRCMGAGEYATDWLVSLGLGRDQGWQFELNDTAMELMRGDEP